MATASAAAPALLTAASVAAVVQAVVPRHDRGIRRLTPRRRMASRSVVLKDRWQLSLPAVALRLGVVIAVGAVVVALLGARLLISTLAATVIALVVLKEQRRQRQRRVMALRRARVIEACAVLAADLRAGRTPQDAMEGAASVCGDLQLAAAAARLGGDVGAALDRVASTPGAGGLRGLEAAWRVAESSGAAFATIAERLADSLRTDESVRRQVSAGLAGTRATARLLAGLPLFGTMLGYAIGADPLAFLTGTPPGWACLFTGLALAAVGLSWVERLARSCEDER